MNRNDTINDNLTDKFTQGVQERVISGGDLLSLGLGQPDFKVPELVVKETISALIKGMSMYTSPLGIVELREAISNNYSKLHDKIIDKNNIIITPGTRQALLISLISILEPEDEVIIFSPYFSSYPAIVKIAHPYAKVVEYNFAPDSSEIDFVRLEKLINNKTKIIISNFPHNPTGAILNKKSYEQLSSLILKHKLFVISDEVYEKVVFGDGSYLLSQNDKLKDLLFLVSGFSKSYAMTGWRIGYIVFPEKFRNTISKISLHMNACTNTFIQYGAAKAFEVSDTYLVQNRNHLMINRDKLINLLERYGLSFFYPKSGYFCFVNISKFNVKSNDFCYLLVKNEGVAITPGIACGENWDDYVRISFAVDEEVFQNAILRIEKFCKENIYIL
jgi:aspartate/methionine/tyrosine aminotransferase